jgi:hypothetical protein
MAESEFWGYEKRRLKETWEAYWKLGWRDFGEGAANLILSILLLQWFGLFPKESPDVFEKILIPILVLVAFLILRFVWRYVFLVPHALYKRNDELTKQLQQFKIGCTMTGSEALEYMAEHSGLETKRQIESALSVAAFKGEIDVEAMRRDDFDVWKGDDRHLPVESSIFRHATFVLEPQTERWKQRFGYSEENAKMGGSISRLDDRSKILYDCPMFSRAQIVALASRIKNPLGGAANDATSS